MSVQCNCNMCKGQAFFTRKCVNSHVEIYGRFEGSMAFIDSQRDIYFDQLDRSEELQSNDSEIEDMDTTETSLDDGFNLSVNLDDGSGQDNKDDDIIDDTLELEEDNWDEAFGEKEREVVNNAAEMVFGDVVEDEVSYALESEDYPGMDRFLHLSHWFAKLLLWWQGRYNITNAALSFLLMILHGLFKLISHPLHQVIPKTLYDVQKFNVANEQGWKTMVVCPSENCSEVHNLCDTFEVKNGVKVVKKCGRIDFQKACQENLLFSKGLSNNKVSLVPFKVFLFNPPSIWIREMMKSKKFRHLLQKRFRRCSSVEMEDIWDGCLWKEFTEGNNGFLLHTYNIAFMLFIDWVKPYKRSQYSIGTIYLAVLNLPRSERFLKKWMCVVGIMPGPTEPKVHMNTYLRPLVDDLLVLWRGIEVIIEENEQPIKIKAILLSLSGDTPAIRKASQFLSYTANKGCNKCEFKADREKDSGGMLTGRMSYLAQNFNFKLRTKYEVLRQSEEFCNAHNKTTANKIASKNGVRYSELHRLPYFDPVSMCAIDPMHAILLGLVKKEISLLIGQNADEEAILNLADIDKVKQRLKRINVPSDCGRLPTALLEKASLDGFTAQQWLLFASIYARPCFYEIIPDENYKCLVLLCQIVDLVCKYKITIEEVEQLRGMIIEHHKLFGSIYGKWKVSINNHLVLHLADVISCYGPCHSFWCFASERLNGILSGLPTSGRSVEKEVFGRFTKQQQLSASDIFQTLPEALYKDIKDNCPSVIHMTENEQDTEETEKIAHEKHIEQISAENFLSQKGQQDDDSFERQRAIERGESTYLFKDAIMLPPQRSNKTMSDELMRQVEEHLNDVFEDRCVHISPVFSKFGRCSVNGMLLSSSMSRSQRSSYCKAYWAVNESELPQPYFCMIEFFLLVNAVVKCTDSDQTIRKQFKLAFVKWYRPHSSRIATKKKTGLCRIQNAFYTQYNLISVYRLARRVVPCNVGNSFLIADLQV